MSLELSYYFLFFFNDTATTEIYTLSLHDALPIYLDQPVAEQRMAVDGRLSRQADACRGIWCRRGCNFILAQASQHCVARSEEHTSELQSRLHLVCRLLLEKKKRHQSESFSGRIPK